MGVCVGPDFQQCGAELALFILVGCEILHTPFGGVLRRFVAACKD